MLRRDVVKDYTSPFRARPTIVCCGTARVPRSGVLFCAVCDSIEPLAGAGRTPPTPAWFAAATNDHSAPDRTRRCACDRCNP